MYLNNFHTVMRRKQLSTHSLTVNCYTWRSTLTFFGEKTPTRLLSSLSATPISASTASLHHVITTQLTLQRTHHSQQLRQQSTEH